MCDNFMNIGLGLMEIFSEPSPENLPWSRLNIDLVFECSGRFTQKEQSHETFASWSQRVLISAQEKRRFNGCVRVNHHELSSEHQILSNASCTTNCLAPIVSVLHKAF